MQTVETIIVGGGQAGLATSYYLQTYRHEHLVLEKAAQAGHAWRHDRWDSFSLLTPNWAFRIPGAEYQGENRDGFMPRDEIVACFEQYVERYQLPVRYGEPVTAVEKIPGEKGYRVKTDREDYRSDNVVIATGLFQQAKLPGFSSGLDGSILQLHSSRYRNPQSLPPGAVLVVGSAQSGCQIAEELYQSGRTVYLCVGNAGRAPRQYRGKDIFEWLHLSGFLDRTVDKLPSPRARFAGNPHLSGKAGGHSLNLHQFARDGVKLLGRISDGNGTRIRLAPDRNENLASADQFEVDLTKLVDGYIQQNGLDAPKEKLPQWRDGFRGAELGELDLRKAGVSSVIWAAGYSFDFSLVKLPVTDEYGYPVQQRGVTAYAGLYFVGLHWLYKNKSGLLIGVGEDAEYIAAHIASRHG